MSGRLDLSQSRYDQSTYLGRVKHMFEVTDPLTILASDKDLDSARDLVVAYRAGKEPKGTTDEQVWAAKKLYDSAFHPQTGEKNFILGRMSCQVPGNMIITGCMMTFYKSTPQLIFWNFANQSFNAIVNYTNRNASSSISNEMLATAFVSATTASVAVAVTLNNFIQKSPTLSKGVIGRFVPLMAVGAANCINIPLMRQVELKEGITVSTEDGKEIGKSKNAALSAVLQVIPSRILMALPSMGLTPLVMAALDARGIIARMPWINLPATLAVTGISLVVSTPACCAIFPQTAAISLSSLEPELKEKVEKLVRPAPSHLYYNKGL
eukprot:CAMPEP_0173391456 /NCGR_PEP_ID=MMETSP1356-20130122/18394_1 /TAXON_ID=77927 ORGANISM="Hemiselmis virescens, Strain PCC157" /NCGR_SAMPLE_ID=MMETSP1356 /ASSEMBLY_ACC=CAM_ASM_000847 /LENGTH=323 /DNA_ID=CAMNT_0014349089 /DNA_START=32 /DNA_END=1003 /DNA_ORIENTATION=-